MSMSILSVLVLVAASVVAQDAGDDQLVTGLQESWAAW